MNSARKFVFGATLAFSAIGGQVGFAEEQIQCLELPQLVGFLDGELAAPSGTLPLEIQLLATSEGEQNAVLTSPEQHAYGILGLATWKGCTSKMDFPSIQARFDGEYESKSKTVKGTWSQAKKNLPLTLSFSSTKIADEALKQETVVRSEVAFLSADGSTRLTGQVTHPNEGVGRIGVVLLSGSGAQDLDQSVFGHKPFAIWSQYLSSQGFTVLRFNDRGVNGSEGDQLSSTLPDLADDAIGAVNALPRNVERTYILAHSEGAIVAAVAASQLRGLNGIVLLSPQVEPLDKVLLQQIEFHLKAGKASGADIKTALSTQREIYRLVRSSESKEIRQQKVRELFLSKGYSAELAELNSNEILSDAFVSRLNFVPLDVYSAINVRTLVIFGDKDTHIRPVRSSQLLSSLPAFSKRDTSVRVMNGRNHLLQRATTGLPEEYSQIDHAVDQEILEMVKDWLLQDDANGQ